MCYQEIPLTGLCVCVCIGRLEGAVSVYQLKSISLDVPLRMSSAALLQVTAEGSVPSFSEGLAHSLRFFASYQYIHAYIDIK